jgi:hypothetical protein
MGNNMWDEMMKENLPPFKISYFHFTFSNNLNNQIWNAQLEKSFHQDEFTIFFSIKDILNQNIGIDRNLTGNTFTEIRNDRLKRYWMLGFRWDFKNKNAVAK